MGTHLEGAWKSGEDGLDNGLRLLESLLHSAATDSPSGLDYPGLTLPRFRTAFCALRDCKIIEVNTINYTKSIVRCNYGFIKITNLLFDRTSLRQILHRSHDYINLRDGRGRHASNFNRVSTPSRPRGGSSRHPDPNPAPTKGVMQSI